jgi:hypothetical protein
LLTNKDGKRNIQSMKNSLKGRKKRDIDAAGPDPLYENNPSDYEDIIQALREEYPLEKRFLGEFFFSHFM